MRAVVLNEFGGPEVLRWQESATPGLGETDILLDVAAAGVNRADILQRKGFYPPPAGESEILGLECSGVVRAVGSNVSGFASGDQVCALLSGGGYAQQVAVPAGQVMPLPANCDLATGAAIPEVAATVWSNLTDVAGLAAGQTVLIHGGSGGIGTFAIQYAKAIGARVAVTAGTAAKLQVCRDLGADICINYREDDFVEVMRDCGGADVILDNMGAKYLARNIAALAPDGSLVVIGMQGGTRAELDLGALIATRGCVHATSLRSRSREAKARICRTLVADVWPMISDGRIQPVIDTMLPIADVARAHERMEASSHIGKIVLTVAEAQ